MDDGRGADHPPRARVLPHTLRGGLTQAYKTLSGRGEAATKVRGSTFLALAAPAATEDAAREVLTALERRYFDATHNCSAWRIHDGPWRANDAGEPSGSAGAPILAAIDGAGLQDVVVVVTRYYGGTKLGVGGLVRAYGEAAAAAIEAAPVQRAVPALRFVLRYPYDLTSAVMRALERTGATAIEHGYAAGGTAGELTCTVPAAAEADLRDILLEQTGGAVAPEELGRTTVYLPISG